MRFFILFLLSFAFSAAALSAPLKVVTSFTILADLTHAVAGDLARVTSLVGPDGDIHAYEPTPSDARAVADADMVIVNGLGLEGWLDRLTAAADYKGPVVVASVGITPLLIAGAPDPHAWQDVTNAKRYVATIAAALSKADPAHAKNYGQNAKAYLLQLDALDRWVRAQVAKVPAEKRRAITSHDALNYFAHAYGITFIAPLGMSTSGDVSAATVAHIIDQIRAGKVRAVFLENMTDPRLLKQLAEDGGAVIGGTIYSDALSGPGGAADSYISMMYHNVNVMTQAMAKN